jgi:NAD(P)H dehydrogenase (quinone)
MKTKSTYAVMGITGQVGGATAQALLEAGHNVRGIVRDKARAAKWESAGVELALGDYNNVDALSAAFRGVDGVFVMLPADFAPSPDFPKARAESRVLRETLTAAMPPKVVVLSSIGAHHPTGLGLITNLHILEEALASLPMPITFLRPGWFMENSAWDIDPAMKTGAISSFLHPLDKPIPMVATSDIGRVAAESLQETWSGRRIVELEGPRRYSPNDLAEALSVTLGRRISALAVPRNEWDSLFQSQGTSDPAPRIEMLDGFNSDWISFEGSPATHVKGRIGLQSVIKTLVDQRGA